MAGNTGRRRSGCWRVRDESHARGARGDKFRMLQNQPFHEQLECVFEAASQAVEGGAIATDTVLLIGHEGQVRILQHSDWTLASLAAHHGAARAYRVTRRGEEVRVAARAGAAFNEISSLKEIHWLKQRSKHPQSNL